MMYEETYFECKRCFGYWDMYEYQREKLEKNKCCFCGKASLCNKCYDCGEYKRHCYKCNYNIENRRLTKRLEIRRKKEISSETPNVDKNG